MSDTDPEADDTTAESHQADAEQAEEHGPHEARPHRFRRAGPDPVSAAGRGDRDAGAPDQHRRLVGYGPSRGPAGTAGFAASTRSDAEYRSRRTAALVERLAGLGQ